MNLPLPEPLAREQSDLLTAALRNRIANAGGWISFADYMDAVLYTPGTGYYSGSAIKFGAPGDFVTAPEISTLFGQTLAQQVAQILEFLPNSSILEFGAGSGKLAADILRELDNLKCLPVSYEILDISPDLQQRQQATLNQIPRLASRIRWLISLPEQFSGVIIVNEVLDAMPTHLVVWREEGIFEQGVIWSNNTFAWQEQPLEAGELLEIARQLPPAANLSLYPNYHYVSEISLANQRFIRTLADLTQQGVILLVDYGFGQKEYYHPQRHQGTMMCHYRHHVHGDPFFLPGLQDITSHVDFSAIATSALASGLQLLGYTTQAHFLVNCGITRLLARTPADDLGKFLPLTNQVQRLVSPAEMGELFKVMALGKSIDLPLDGFAGGDLRRLL